MTLGWVFSSLSTINFTRFSTNTIQTVVEVGLWGFLNPPLGPRFQPRSAEESKVKATQLHQLFRTVQIHRGEVDAWRPGGFRRDAVHVTQEFPRGLWSWFGDTLVAELV